MKHYQVWFDQLNHDLPADMVSYTSNASLEAILADAKGLGYIIITPSKPTTNVIGKIIKRLAIPVNRIVRIDEIE